MVEMGKSRFGDLKARGGDLPGQGDATARGLGFVPIQPIGRTVRKAQAAHHALIGEGTEIEVRLPVGRIGHDLMLSFAARCAPLFAGRRLARYGTFLYSPAPFAVSSPSTASRF